MVKSKIDHTQGPFPATWLYFDFFENLVAVWGSIITADIDTPLRAFKEAAGRVVCVQICGATPRKFAHHHKSSGPFKGGVVYQCRPPILIGGMRFPTTVVMISPRGGDVICG